MIIIKVLQKNFSNNLYYEVFMKIHVENLTIEQKDLLIGTLLGDAHLATKTQGRTWYYDIKHSMSKLDYLKFEILKNLCKKVPYRYNSRSPSSCNFVVYFRFWTRSFSFLSLYGNMFYFYDEQFNRYKKDVPENIKEYLTPRAIAFWYMDDGYINLKGNSITVVLCTDNFSLLGVNRLKIVLVPRKQHNEIKGYRLYIYSSNALNFCDLVRPYIIPSMLYKLNQV